MTARSLDLEDIDIARLPDVQSDFNKFRLCIRRYSTWGSILDHLGLIYAVLLSPILISTLISMCNLMFDFPLETYPDKSKIQLKNR